MTDFEHFRLVIAAMLPNSVWETPDIIALNDHRFRVARLSDLPLPESPPLILYADRPDGCPVPATRWTLGSSRLWKYEATRPLKEVPIPASLKTAGCGDPACISCLFSSYPVARGMMMEGKVYV